MLYYRQQDSFGYQSQFQDSTHNGSDAELPALISFQDFNTPMGSKEQGFERLDNSRSPFRLTLLGELTGQNKYRS